MYDMKLCHVCLPKSLDDDVKMLARKLSTDENPITISDIIRAALATAIGQQYHITKDILKAYFELRIDLDVLTEMDHDTIKTIIALAK